MSLTVGFEPCYVNSRLVSRGIPVACEVDVYGALSENDFAKIEAKMMELAKKNEPVVRKEVSKADALAEFKAGGQTYKCEHIEQDLEDGTITTYTQGNFTDLCRGPHLMNTGLIKAVKITSVAGAFWRLS